MELTTYSYRNHLLGLQHWNALASDFFLRSTTLPLKQTPVAAMNDPSCPFSLSWKAS